MSALITWIKPDAAVAGGLPTTVLGESEGVIHIDGAAAGGCDRNYPEYQKSNGYQMKTAGVLLTFEEN